MSHKRFVINSTIFSGLSIYVESFIGLIISMLVARHLGPEDLGNYSLLLWFASLGIVIANGGLNSAIIKFVAEARGKGEVGIGKGILGYLFKLQMIFLPISLLITALAGYFLFGRIFDEQQTLLLFAVVLAIAPKAMQLFNISVIKGYESFKSIFYINIIATPINLLIVVCIIVFDGGLREFVWSYLFVSLIYFIASYYLASKLIIEDSDNKVPVPDEYKLRINKFVKIAVINAAIFFVVSRELEIVFLKWLADAADVGYYSIAFRLSEMIVVLVPGIFATVLLPLMARSLAEGQDVLTHRYRESARFLMILAAPFFVFCTLFADDIIITMYGDQYHPAIFPFRVLLIVFGFTILNSVTTSILLSLDRQEKLLKILFFTAIVNICLDYFLIKEYGINGAVSASVISKLVFSISCQLYIYKLIKTKLPYLDYIQIYMIAIALLLPLYFINQAFDSLIILALGAIVFFIAYVYILTVVSKIKKDEVEILTSYFNKIPILKKLRPHHN